MTMTAQIVEQNAAKVSDLLGVIVAKARQACFVDIIAGLGLIGIGVALWLLHATPDHWLHAGWLLVAALGVTRGGDTVKHAARDFAYFWHRTPEHP